MRHFNDWSPFVATMPEASYSFEGPDFGVGSTISWVANGPEADVGSQTIKTSNPYDRVDVELDLGADGEARSAYILKPDGEGTHVTWTFDTDFGYDLPGRYRGIFLDRQLGPLYAQGLVNLKRICEELPKTDWTDVEIAITEVPSTTIAYATGNSGSDPTEISAALAAAYGRVAAFVATNGLQIAGPPLAITNYRDDRGWGFDAGIPVSGTPARGAGPDSPVQMGETYGGRVVRAVHLGASTGLQASYDKIEAFLVAHKLDRNGRPWDVYVSDPGSVPEDQLTTEIFVPVK
jgi:effector-binding domain-containing protein